MRSAKSPGSCAPRFVPTTSAFATPATSSSSCCRDAGLTRRAEAARAAAGDRRGLLRGPSGQAAGARDQRRDRGVPARRRVIRGAARDCRQPDVSGQGQSQETCGQERHGHRSARALPIRRDGRADGDIQRTASGLLNLTRCFRSPLAVRRARRLFLSLGLSRGSGTGVGHRASRRL